MQRLAKFNKNGKNKKIIIMLVVVFAVVISLVIGSTYAIYQKENEVTFINAKVRFPKANEVTYTTSNNSSVTNVEQALNDLYEKLGE